MSSNIKFYIGIVMCGFAASLLVATLAIYEALQENKCEDYKDIIATTKVCVDDKNMKCFMTPEHLREFAVALREFESCSIN